MKTKSLILGLGMLCLNAASYAQGLTGIVVEKYYLTNAADGANALANSASTTLNTGTTVYRVYVDMAAGYKFSQIYGNAAHNLKVNTTTNFYNDPNYGVSLNPGTISLVNVKKNTAMIDSYFTTGGTATGKVGVPKTEDTDGTLGNTQNILANNAGGCFGLPIMGTSGQDGMVASSGSTYVVPNALGLGTTLDVLDQTVGNSITITNGSIAALGGIIGATTSNMVLVGQFTTNGSFSFELNVQLVNIATGLAENYVASNPTGSEQTHASLILGANAAPTVSITAPANNAAIITGTVVSVTATAADANGTVSQVEFFVDGTSIGVDATSPYAASYTAVLGSHNITAQAKDNDCAVTTSSTVAITVANNQAPTVSVSAPSSTPAGTSITFTATANDVDGTVAQVEFFVNNVSVGVDNASPYTVNWTSTPGNKTIVAKATDNNSAITTSATLSLVIADPNALPYAIQSNTQNCDVPTFCIPLAVALASPIDNVKGYDVVLNYDNTKLIPTGNITVYNDLTTASYVETAYAINAPVNNVGSMNISAYFNGTAPSSAEFQGTGKIFCVEFAKSTAVIYNLYARSHDVCDIT